MPDITLPLFSLQPETKEIPLTQGKVAIVDAADFERLSQWKWSAHKMKNTWYAVRGYRLNGKSFLVRMHREITNAEAKESVDHIDGDGLNNRRENLRRCSQQQNCANRGPSRNNTSGFKGVSWQKGKWRVGIKIAYRRIYLGSFDDIGEAARAYDDAARRLYGEFARLNFPECECRDALREGVAA